MSPDEGKTKEQLIDELAQMRQRLAEVEASETERKRVESEERYRALFENLNDAAFLADTETGRILDTNKQGEVLLGRSREEIIGMHQRELHPPEKADEYRQRFATHVQKGRAADYDGEAIRKDGSIVPVNISAAPVAIGEKQLILGLFRDITERRRMEEALTESEKRFRGLANFLPLTVFEMDDEGNFTFINRQGFETFGYPIGEISEAPTRLETTVEIFVPEDRDRVRENRQSVLNGEDIGNVGYTAVRRDGSTFPVEVFYAPIIHAGKRTGLRGVLIDITERKRAEEAMRDATQNWLSLTENTNDFIMIVDNKGKIKYINRAIPPDTVEQVIGKTVYDFAAPEHHRMIRQSVRRVFETGEQVSYESSVKHPTGILWFETKIIPIGEEKKTTSAMSFNTDITERKRVEEELRNSHDYLKQLTDSMGDAVFSIKIPERVIEWANDSFRLIGYEPEDCIGKTTEFLYSDESEFLAFGNKLKSAITAGKDVLHTEQQLRRENGEVFPAEITATLSREKDEVVRVTSIVRDITERKRIEDALRKSEKQASAAIEAARALTFNYDIATGKIEWGGAIEEITGYTKKEFAKIDIEGWAERIHPDDRAEILSILQEALGKDRATAEYRFKTKKGYVTLSSISLTEKEDGEAVRLVGILQDVTQRRQAEEEVRESEKRYRELADFLPQTIYEIGERGNITFLNRQGFQSFGYTVEDLDNGLQTLQMCSDEDRDKAIEDGRKVFDGEEVGGNEYIAVRKDGTTFPVLVYATPITRGNRIVGLRGLIIDITERKRAEEALQKSAEQYRDLFESVLDGVVVIDAETMKMVLANRAAANIGGFDSVEELLEANLLDFIAPEERERLIRTMVEDMFEKDLRQVNEFRCIKKNGEEIWISAIGARTEYQGRLAGLASFRDVTERKRAEAELRESEERYRALVNLGGKLGEAIVMLQDTERGQAMHIFVSNEWPRITGYSRKELLGMSFLDLLHPEHRAASLKRHGRRMRGEIMPGLFEMSIIRKDGTEVPVELTSAYTTYKGERANVAFIRDITERKQAEEREKELQQELNLSSRLASIGQLAAGVAHEINNPLTGILGFSERLMRKSAGGEIRRDLERIHNEAWRAARVVENLLAFARRREPKKEYLDINEILARTVELRAYEMRTGNIDLVTELAPSLPEIVGDFGQIQQVFLNIILNAEQAMTEANRGGKLTIKSQPGKGCIRVSFADDGPGIAAGDLDRVFNPFFTTRGERGGTGLGLSACHGIVTEHGGRIYVRSKPGQGATFYVELPLTDEEARQG